MVDGGVGFDVRAVYGDVPELEEFEFFGQFEHADKGFAEGVEVFAAELADGVVVGMGVAGEVTHGKVTMGGILDLARGEEAVGVAVDEQRKHHMWRELPISRAAMVDLEVFQRKPVDGFDDEVDEIVFRHPISHVHG